MLTLAAANLAHHRVRSVLSVAAVAIAITLLLLLVGLSHGTLNDVSNRMESVNADVLVSDRHFDVASFSGGKLWEKEIPDLLALTVNDLPAVQTVIPVFMGRMKLANQSQNVFGVHPEHFDYFLAHRRFLDGALFQDVPDPAQALALVEADPDADHAPALPLIVDQRLARAADLHVGYTARLGAIPIRIVGIVETGVAGRVFAPINMLRGANGVSAPTAHLFFLRTAENLDPEGLQQLCDDIARSTRRAATPLAGYSNLLAQNFRSLTLFVSLVSVISLAICFLFILVTIYTSVLERAREIAILQSLGATRSLVLAQTVQESLLICSIGTALGIAAAFAARWTIQTLLPLMTVDIQPRWLALAALVGIGGGILSALYPAWVALRRDPVETLSFE